MPSTQAKALRNALTNCGVVLGRHQKMDIVGHQAIGVNGDPVKNNPSVPLFLFPQKQGAQAGPLPLRDRVSRVPQPVDACAISLSWFN